MSLPFPENPKQVIDDTKTDVQRELPLSNPFLPNSWIGALITGFANRIFDNYQAIKLTIDQAFYDSSNEEFLKRQAAWYGIYQKAETKSSGNIIFTGTNGTLIPANTNVVSENGVTIKTLSNGTISNQSTIDFVATKINEIATIVFDYPHLISNGVSITVSGVSVPEFNGTFSVTVIDEKTISYEMLSAPLNNPSVGGTVTYISVSIPCESITYGEIANIQSEEKLTLEVSISGVDDDCYPDILGLTGGTDIEDVEEMRARLLYRVANPVANFNVSAITNKALSVPGITRVFVKETTPLLGQVTIYPMKDNDEANTIPTAQDLINVKNAILEIKPANTSDLDVIVSAPIASIENFEFLNIFPDTESMRFSVGEQLREFFATKTNISAGVSADEYKTALYNTLDQDTGEQLKSFVLNFPTNDLIVLNGEIAVLGTVSFV